MIKKRLESLEQKTPDNNAYQQALFEAATNPQKHPPEKQPPELTPDNESPYIRALWQRERDKHLAIDPNAAMQSYFRQ